MIVAISSLVVLVAGTMCAGIALLGVFGVFDTLVYVPPPVARERGVTYVRKGLAKWEVDDSRLHLASSLDELGDCDLVIEAVPENPALKREIFAQLDGPILATNTSSI